jgi:hypothetical protein
MFCWAARNLLLFYKVECGARAVALHMHVALCDSLSSRIGVDSTAQYSAVQLCFVLKCGAQWMLSQWF